MLIYQRVSFFSFLDGDRHFEKLTHILRSRRVPTMVPAFPHGINKSTSDGLCQILFPSYLEWLLFFLGNNTSIPSRYRLSRLFGAVDIVLDLRIFLQPSVQGEINWRNLDPSQCLVAHVSRWEKAATEGEANCRSLRIGERPFDEGHWTNKTDDLLFKFKSLKPLLMAILNILNILNISNIWNILNIFNDMYNIYIIYYIVCTGWICLWTVVPSFTSLIYKFTMNPASI